MKRRACTAKLARESGAETIDSKKNDVYESIQEVTRGLGADARIDAVGTRAEPSASLDSMVDRAQTTTFLGTDRPDRI